ncbi:MAG: nitroreductase [Myxococcales bacterium]|nr:nitroreductase [Myxococcales bacterium]
MELTEALVARRSVRGFRPEPVPRGVLAEIFGLAQRSPSWCNIQPWRVWVTSPPATARIAGALTAAAESTPPNPDFAFPGTYPAPYDAHRRACGKALYDAMGIAREDKAARWDAWLRNFRGFDAPHLAFVAVDRAFGVYGALDIGCWLESVLLLATERGVGSCAQAALATYPDIVRAELAVPSELGLLCGIALGYEDSSIRANACRTTREPLESNIVWVER